MTKKKLYQDVRLYTFLGIIAFLFIHHWYGYFGHYGYDDIMGYGYYGKKWADGNLFFLNDDFFSYRWGFISLTGLFYALFGMSDGVSAIAPSWILLTTVLLIFKATKNAAPVIGVIASLIYVSDNWTLFYSDKLMPDTSVALCAFGAFVAIHHFRYTKQGAKPILNAFVLALILLIGYICKQTILLLIPVFFYLFLYDVFNKKNLKYWGAVVLFCISLGLLYLLGIYVLTGDPMMRFKVAEEGHAANLGRSFAHCNYAAQSWGALINRITLGFVARLLNGGMMLCVIVALPAVFSQKIRSILQQKTEQNYWTLVFVLSFLSANFMTTSYKVYQPMCLDLRHFLFLVPMAAVVAAPVLYDFAKEKSFKWHFGIVAVVSVSMAFGLVGGNMKWAYLALSSCILLRIILPNNNIIQSGFWLGIALSLLAGTISNILEARKNGYIYQREAIYQFFKERPHNSIIITDPIQRNFGLYLLEFEDNITTQFYTFDELDSLEFAPNIPVYILTNGYTQYMSNFKYHNLPKCILATHKNQRPPEVSILYKKKNIALYQIHDVKILK